MSEGESEGERMRLIEADALIERIESDIKAIEDKEPQMAMGAIGVLNTIKKTPTEKLQLSPKTSTKTSKTSTNGTYIRDGKLINDLVYRGEAEVSDTVEESITIQTGQTYGKSAYVAGDPDTDLISRQAAIEAWDKLSKRGRTEFDQVLMTLPSAETPEKRTETHGVCSDCISRQAAIDALCRECTPVGYECRADCTEVEILRKLPPVEPPKKDRPVCEDCISRADTIRAICKECDFKGDCGGECTDVEVVSGMPPVEPERPRGGVGGKDDE